MNFFQFNSFFHDVGQTNTQTKPSQILGFGQNLLPSPAFIGLNGQAANADSSKKQILFFYLFVCIFADCHCVVSVLVCV